MKKTNRQDGFALILALLALMLLTSLGLSLSTTTSTELQISVNHRWSEQARYNAEAGIEFGLQTLTAVADWETILPARRGVSWLATSAVGGSAANSGALNRDDAWGNPSRNFENWSCDSRGFGQGYGIVLDDGDGTTHQYQTQAGGLALNGAFTLWVRRPVMWSEVDPTKLEDYPGTDPVTGAPRPAPAPGFGVMILVSEGVAPFAPGLANQGAANRATQIIELVISQNGTTTTTSASSSTGCSARQGQAGGSASGTNAQGCAMLNGASVVAALTGAANTQNAGNLR